MQKSLSTILLLSFLFGLSLNAQTVRISVGVQYVPAEQSTLVPIIAEEFVDVDAFQFSLAWDPDYMSFEQIESLGLPLLTSANFGTSFTDEGLLTILWTGNLINGETLMPGDTLFGIRFLTSEDCMSSSEFGFPEIPVAPRFLRFEDFDPVELNYEFTEKMLMNYCPLVLDSIEIVDNECLGDSIGMATPVVTGGVVPYTYLWSNGDTSNVLTGVTAGVYNLTITDAINNTLLVESLNIGDGDMLLLELGADTTLCGEDQFIIQGEAQGLTSIAWYWNGNFWAETSTTELQVSESGLFSALGMNDFGCEITDTIQILFAEFPEATIITSDTTICYSDTIMLAAETVAGAEYTWESSSGNLSNPNDLIPLVYPADSVELFTFVSSNNCGTDTATISITRQYSNVSAGRDTCIAAGKRIMLNATGGVSYQWMTTEYELSDYSIPNPVTSPSDSTWYIVQITDSLSCHYLDSVYVAVIEDPLRFIPIINILTPNKDGHNDLLVFPGLEKYEGSRLQVFNRWGGTVFKSTDYQNDWDGTKNGELLPAGIYFYHLQVEKQERRQTLTIITP
jgi:gliding motility-associated-like protein